ncbi:aminotransferase class I and II [Flavobacterium sp. MAH-1]|uniref:Aminotransferase class I and II n=1 Tax=Flavobacterium agri TaxID=2743471 RepID=A0A7Y9C5M0_9FLAO|nr:HipA family kinase [Flavobacterium agri]NUY79488.1 aminotransferase class I and II [Flavobacterium agri]NYA69513.1 aminotransferase class I and II [Flavobacterium agri]
MSLRTITVTRYILPLREGGSLPALAEGDDDFKYVLKFRGAGHGVKMLIGELIGGEIARKLGLHTPELVFAYLDEAFGQSEADEEIQDLLKFSQGLNLAMHYLSGAITFDPVVSEIDAKLASQIVWLDAFLTNVDRTFRNTNMLIWHKELWLIDHGASLYFHHSFTDPEGHAKSPFAMVKDHVLLRKATELQTVDAEFKKILTDEVLSGIVNLIPDDWLHWEESELLPDEIRAVYLTFLKVRRDNSNIFIKQADDARAAL